MRLIASQPELGDALGRLAEQTQKGPFVYEKVSEAPVVLVIENHHTYESARRALGDPTAALALWRMRRTGLQRLGQLPGRARSDP